ncbi:tail fiber protein [Altibacter sp. HG106]|uniref:tail fiber protein n=1 Tax=Altibacter sp. HG106 TaxID=3023937 RepID=UPI00235003A5|nr:tail fiber protein [Altibacter sp. HG106]MDC7996124.1 tail fiber protein [Altibacter sp. HG106]
MKKWLFLSLVVLISVQCSAQRNNGSAIKEYQGKVGIGTNTPDALLTVKGTIHTREVLVDLEGAVAPDYVFEAYTSGVSKRKPDYERLSLKALAAYIRSEGHLPKVPSARELEEEGIALKQFNLLLLEKIEELTLYTLEQQQEIDALREKLSKLEE